ncbi:zinc finger protein 502-like isoform X1 [Myxocyprinus asiaticus]|uniref:zinc finger protein 502-like isoform X1 n=1 Tax=Myxocyprinus asiaticus TaxID=70543 RepID=UPI002223ADF5|nr:zinc finger protein 502-like isoform X1 [Myxocyprinus asiaticus]XP_051553902.1 zinc finger protein 502-like isoform X1 [Myxocyprinus asiaticus]XP_051553903.1 zinc finger protein 502-like isoform X1 [Myxocyprinus asiaticus]
MDCIKEEREDMGYPEPHKVKNEDTEEQIDLMKVKKENEELNEVEEKHQHQKSPNVTPGERSFSCSQTEQNSSQQTKDHIRINNAKNVYTCPQCGENFTRKTFFTSHARIHAKDKPIACLQCGMRFKFEVHLKTHMRIHSGERPFICPHCGKGFFFFKFLENHMLCEHPGAKSLNCDECAKNAIVPSNEKPHLCSICGKSFFCLHRFKEHQEIHSGKTHVCPECGDAFAKAGNLKMHQKIHNPEKTYTCSHCGKSFTHSVALKIHEKEHTEEKPSSVKSYTLSTHFKKHSGKKSQ